MQLKSKPWREITAAFIERRRAGDKPVGTPDHVVTAMLEDLRALEAECERLREKNAKLIAENNDLVNELNGWGKGYDDLQAENARLRALMPSGLLRTSIRLCASHTKSARPHTAQQVNEWLDNLESEAADDR